MKDQELNNLLNHAFHEGREGMAELFTAQSGAGKPVRTTEISSAGMDPRDRNPGIGIEGLSIPPGSISGHRKLSRRTWLVSAAAILGVVVLGLGGLQAWRGYTIHQMAMEETVRYLEDLMNRT